MFRWSVRRWIAFGSVLFVSSCLAVIVTMSGSSVPISSPPPKPVPQSNSRSSGSFWDSFGRVEVYVLTVPQTLNRWRHLRDVISTGPWPATLIEGCTPSTPIVAAALVNRTHLQEKAVALVCSHYRAVEDAKNKNLDFALILEDDAQFINDFWRRLETRLRQLPKFGVFYLQHACGEAILKLDKRNLIMHDRRPIARRFSPHEVYALGAGAFDGAVATIWDAGGYLLSRNGIGVIAGRSLTEWLHRSRSSFQIYSSEMLLSEAADGDGAFFSIPPLIYQCTTKTSLIQPGSKGETDKLGRIRQKAMFNAILAQGNEVKMPDWLLECGFDSK